MLQTFKEYLNESDATEETKSIRLYISLANRYNEDSDEEVSITVDYNLIKDDQNYDHENDSYTIDTSSIDYTVNTSFNFENESYKAGQDLSELYMNVFVDDSYTSKSQLLKENIDEYFMKTSLSSDKQDQVFLELLTIMIENK